MSKLLRTPNQPLLDHCYFIFQSPEMESKLAEALSAQNKLQSQVSHYKTVLAETVRISLIMFSMK